ncbi:MAG: grpE [Phenylobacterium sp.]|nr:grpE [Phenylobacterium sp.]
MSEDMDPQVDGADGDAEEIEALRAEAAALKEQVLRYAAEADNTRRRAEREANDARAYAIQKFARDLLGVADNLSRALAAHPESADPVVKNFIVGVEMTEKELQAAFERNGLKKIQPAKGDKFDPHQHQAMMELADTDVAPGAVVEVMQPGYDLLGRLVRPAMVVVAAKGAGTGPKANGSDGSAANPYAVGEDEGSGGAVDTRA